ncbi:MAG: radical SAM/SPASM domain-containing protein [Acidobacteria bacterium]|nr:radical SAM/SPASM domain-containing protein [Acidobacteriota bacterium]
MESIYYVMSWLCHRTCRHCYEDRFRPYHGEELERVVATARSAFPKVIANFPKRMTYFENGVEKSGRVIVAGGEILLDPVRESVLYPALELLHARYAQQGGVKLIVQTTGDTLRPGIIDELLERNVWMISVSGIDSFHEGLETEPAQQALVTKLTGMFQAAGLRPFAPIAAETGEADETQRHYQFFGAQPDSWIGRLWPRGRAMSNCLSTATLEDNFCNRWSGGLNFLRSAERGSEVSIDPDGNVFPCCAKTKRALGNLQSESLESILDRAAKSPVYQAINAGQPQRMGLTFGWTEADFLEKSKRVLPNGAAYQNLCIGCDAFHHEMLPAALVTL